MNFRTKLFRSNRLGDRLFGDWQSDQTHKHTKSTLVDVGIRFTGQGKMIYTIKQNDKDQIILMSYEAANGKIISDQPSMPRKEETTYRP